MCAHRRTRSPTVASLIAALLQLACGVGTDVQSGLASKLALVTAPTSVVASRAAFPMQPSLQLQGANGHDVARAGVRVDAAVTAGGGTLMGSAAATTSAAGTATFTDLAIAGQAGAQTLTFSADGLAPVSTMLTLTAGTAALAAAAAGTGQVGLPGTPVPIPPAILLTDADANPIAGVSVTFAVTAGGGSLTGAAAITDDQGVATVGSWTLGPVTGPNTLTATVAGLADSAVTFTATGSTGSSSAKEITSFAFRTSANSIPVDGVGTISGTSIGVFLPPGTDRSVLRATFTASAGATVTVDDVVQTSGVTANDFATPVVYIVHAEDGSTAADLVTLTTDIASIDQVVNTFMTSYNVPGLSLAITHDENLVYVKAYGQADGTRGASTSDLYRLASLSKQITSVAIMRLLDAGQISLDQKVFGPGAILGTTYGTQPYGTGITDITVDQLLHHTAGGWPYDASDPMFTNPAMTIDELISWTLDNRPLGNTPGTTYAYSNFGYAVLGRVIERITGSPYAAAVDTLVLQPAGVTDMTIAGNTLADRLPNEVRYYGQSGEDPYIYNISRMDSQGGWLATATDLARILVRVDGFSSKTDILSAEAIQAMTTGSTANPSYAAGWVVNGSNWWHVGSLPGTATEQARTTSEGNFNFVILTNTRSLLPTFLTDLDNLFWTALRATSRWPTYDLF